MPRGLDGKRYSIFGPGQAILAVPLVLFAKHIPWPDTWHIPTSHYVSAQSIKDYFQGRRAKPKKAHRIRFFTSFFNSFVGAITVLLFWFVAKEATGCEKGALFAQVSFAFGTVFWHYAGTFFSEPLATAFTLAALYFLLLFRRDGKWQQGALSGFFLGLATTVHLTAILFSPFYLFFLFRLAKDKGQWRGLLSASLIFCLLLLALGYFNYVRFGSLFETGRGVDVREEYQYGKFISPLTGLYGLTLSGGRGLLIFCPIVLFALYAWPAWHKEQPLLSSVIIGTFLFRLLFISSRSDWYGGFCLGPRYLLQLIPLLLLPLAHGASKLMETRSWPFKILFVFLLLCVCQQIYFCTGELFYWLHFQKFELLLTKTRVTDIEFASSWEFTALFDLWQGRTGPWWATAWKVPPLHCGLIFMLLLAPFSYIFWKRLN